MKHAVVFGADFATAVAVFVAVVAVLHTVLVPRGAVGALGSGLGLTLEFLLAAGLLRLATHPNLRGLGLAAFIVLLRKVISTGLRYGRAAAAG